MENFNKEQKEMQLKNFLNNLFSDNQLLINLGLFCIKQYDYETEAKALFKERFEDWKHEYYKKRKGRKAEFKRLLRIELELNK